MNNKAKGLNTDKHITLCNLFHTTAPKIAERIHCQETSWSQIQKLGDYNYVTSINHRGGLQPILFHLEEGCVPEVGQIMLLFNKSCPTPYLYNKLYQVLQTAQSL